jgi:AhpD family alkylhydroperoxidase
VAPNLPLPDDSNASADLAAEYAAAREREGRVMAILRALGPRADVVRAFLDQTHATIFHAASLGRRERELLAVAASEANGAQYSADIHRALLDEEGGGPDGSPRDQALVDFARRLTLAPREGPDAVADLSGHLSPDEIYDAIVVVAHMNTANRVVLAAGITPDDDLY